MATKLKETISCNKHEIVPGIITGNSFLKTSKCRVSVSIINFKNDGFSCDGRRFNESKTSLEFKNYSIITAAGTSCLSVKDRNKILMDKLPTEDK